MTKRITESKRIGLLRMAGCGALLFLFCIGASIAQPRAVWKPGSHIEIIVPSGAGGGLDRTARGIQKILLDRKLVDATISVVNKPGGGSTIGWAYLNQQPADGRYISISASNLLTNQFTMKNPIGHRDVTPIALLFSEYNVFAMRENSPIKSGKDLIETLRQSPASLSIGIANARGNHSHISIGMVAKAAGLDIKKLKVVVFDSGGRLLTALLGGHVDLVAITGGNVLPSLEAKKVRAVAVASPRRLSGAFAPIPTWREQGVDASFSNWRIAIGPKGMTRQQVAYWDQVFGALAKTDEFKKDIEKNQAELSYMNSTDTARYVEAQYDKVKEIMVDLGFSE